MKKIKDKESKLIIVANRLPIRRMKSGNIYSWETSPGGLVSALSPFLQAQAGTWVGWPGSNLNSYKSFIVNKIRQQPVNIQTKELNLYYYGFSNATLWPLYHDSVQIPAYHRHWWKPYVEINKRFARATVKHIRSARDCVWVHDYQLQLVPGYVRELHPKNKIGFFLHIPFPPLALFGHLPWRVQILEGLLGADLIGFQTQPAVKNFLEAVERFTDAKVKNNQIHFRGRIIRVSDFPITVDVDKYENAAKKVGVQKKKGELKKHLNHKRKLILGIDRLDYTKGIENRLKAIETLLSKRRLSIDDFVYVQVVVPSREKIKSYIELKNQIETIVGHLNGEYAAAGKVPIQYLHRNLSFEDLIAYYSAADVMLVTPLRDGMNLVCKEYVCTRLNEDGCLILSEFAGAARELKDALIVNPYDIDGLAECIEKALAIPVAEEKKRMKKLRQTVKNRNVHQWARNFLQSI